MKVTFSVIKADVGSIGGHTRPSEAMVEAVAERMRNACGGPAPLLIDGLVTYTGDDIALIMSHARGPGAEPVHKFAWDCFLAATGIAKSEGLYGAGQDLLVDAPSGNIRGAGPGVAEIEFDRDPKSKDRPAEAILVFAGDKCSPGMFNYPLYSVFCDPMHNGGLLLSPKLHKGFTLTIIDMDHREGDRRIRLDVPERVWDVAALLQNPDRFAIEAVHSRHNKGEQVAAVSATRLHNIAGKYTGKDDPVAVVRTQGIFPAPEEVVEPYMLGHFVTGDCRGSHVMPIMPVAAATPVTGPYCLPIVSCMAFSMDDAGRFARQSVDMFAGSVWDRTRLKVQEKADEWRRQGFIGSTMAAQAELAYTGIIETVQTLDKEFQVR